LIATAFLFAAIVGVVFLWLPLVLLFVIYALTMGRSRHFAYSRFSDSAPLHDKDI